MDMSSHQNSLPDLETDCERNFNKAKRRVDTYKQPIKWQRTCSPARHSDNSGVFLCQKANLNIDRIDINSEIVGCESDNTAEDDSTESFACYFDALSLNQFWIHDTKSYDQSLLIPKTIKPVLRKHKKNLKKSVRTKAHDYGFDYIDNDYLKTVSTALSQHSTEDQLYLYELVVKEDIDGDRLIFVAVITNVYTLCNALLALIPDECFLKSAHNNMYQTALHLAVLVGCPKLTRRLLIAGVEVDRRDRNGDTALHIACKQRDLEVASELLKPVTYCESKQNSYAISYQKVPQNLELRNNQGLTCLLITAYNRHLKLMDLLLSKFADVNARDIKSGKTCLHILVELGDSKGIQHLLTKQGVDVNARTYAGYTALEIADYRNHSFSAYQLLCAGAKPDIRNADSDDFKADSDSE